MFSSKSVWFLERIDFGTKYASMGDQDKARVKAYFKGLKRLASSYALIKQSDLARLVAAAAESTTLPEMPEDAKERAEWTLSLTRDVLGQLTQDQVNEVLAALPSFVEALGGPDKVLEQARSLKLVSESPSSGGLPLDALSSLLNPEMIRQLVSGLQENVKDVTVPSKSGEQMPLSDIVGDTTKVLTDIVEGKADTNEIAGLGQRITESVDWDSIMGMLPPEIASVGRTLVSQMSQQTSSLATAEGGASGAGEAAPEVDMSKVMETVSTIASSLMTPDSPFASLLSGLVASAGAPGGESPLAALLSPKK